MITDRIEGTWVDAFERMLALSAVAAGDEVAVLSETQSRSLKGHYDLPMRGCDIWLDDLLVVKAGELREAPA